MRVFLLLCSLTVVKAFHPDRHLGLQCQVCNASYYCLDGQQFDCPANSLAVVEFADKISECVCNAGYMSKDDLCLLGQPPAWYMHGLNDSCVSTRETIAAGASGHKDCVCKPGFAGLPVQEAVNCQQCPADTYADVHNISTCVPCPEHSSHAQTQRTHVSACLCDPGYSGPDGGPCVACAAGTFKAEPGAAACEECGVNEYANAAATVCVACHANSSSLPASSGVEHCLCDPGFYPSEGLCTMCHAGHFKNTTANEPCRFCIGNTFAAELGATACSSCLVFSPFSTANPSEGGVRCQCIAGYTQTELNLTTPTCIACAPDSFQPSPGQTTCELCDPNARSPQASVTPLACLCNAGFFDDNSHQCQSCAGGTYKNATTDYEEDTEPCNVCPEDSFSLAQRARLVDCLCDPGFSGPDGGPCAACAAGTFKAANGSGACEACPLHTYSDADASTSCKSCTQFLDYGGITLAPGQDSSDACECDVSQGFSTVYINGARKCTGCEAGTYASSAGCKNCSNGTFNDEAGQTACKQCPANASSYDYPHVSCQCHKGMMCTPKPVITHDYTKSFNPYYDGGLKFTMINGNARLFFAVDSMDPNRWQHQEIKTFFFTNYGLFYDEYWGKTFAGQLPECLPSMQIVPCQKIMSSITFFSESHPILGNLRVYIFQWFVLQNNGAGQYYWFQCASFYTAYTQCALFDGQYASIGNGGGTPVHLNAINTCAGYECQPSTTFRSIHLQDPSSCADGLCTACVVNTFKNYTGGSAVCSPCQAFSQSLPASTSEDMCLCKLGYHQDGANACVACTAGKYTDGLDGAQCADCAADTYTPSSVFPFDTLYDCEACAVCNQTTSPAFTDHYDAARGGLGCGLDQPSSCQACPEKASLFLPTTASQRNKGVLSCVCDEHFYGSVGAACSACPQYQFRPGFINAATTEADCLCLAGAEPDPAAANKCRLCPLGTYKPDAGDHNCTACPATLTTEQTGNANASACACVPGFAFDGDRCNICPDNQYKIGFNLIQTCTACTANSFGPAGGTGPLDCTCFSGFNAVEPYAGLCNLCSTGKYKNETANIGKTMIAWDAANKQVNLARSCTGGACSVTASSYDGLSPQNIVDGITNNLWHSKQEWYAWVVIDMQQTVNVEKVRIYNRQDCCGYRMQAFQIRIGHSLTFSANHLCGIYGTPSGFEDYACVQSGRYLSVQNGIFEFFQLAEVEVYGTEPIADEFKCLVCPSNTATNNTGSNVCSACAAGKTTDGRSGQVECVCDTGTEPGADGVLTEVCQTCRAETYKAASTDKYANRACVNCSSCAAGQQVATECNSTLDITCRACQANSWSYAGRTRLDLCFCNAGYELQGELCVACPVGKARQTNANNSIMCETCGSGTFTSVSGSITCDMCSAICNSEWFGLPLTYDFYNPLFPADMGNFDANLRLTLWKDYAASIGATTSVNAMGSRSGHPDGFGFTGVYTNNNNLVNGFSVPTVNFRLALSLKHTVVRVIYRALLNSFVYLYIDNVLKQTCADTRWNSPCEFQTAYTTGQVLELRGDDWVFLGENLQFFFTNPQARLMYRYVQQECNASRDVVCQECQTCSAGFYANNTCGVSYGNDRLDTQCAECPEDYYCPGGSVSQAREPCPDHGKSATGSNAVADCTCDPGFYRSGDICVICPLDSYCPNGVSQPVSCPMPGRTLSVGSTVRMDCHCPRGHFRDPLSDEEGFNCTLCTPDDYCFNNSLYNCSDSLMQSEAGSGFFDNCTCVDGYYNNGTRCEDCSVDHFCVVGKQHVCPPQEWTNGLTRQDACKCRPTFLRAGTECVKCADNFFCDGTDDSQQQCPENSISNNASQISQCLCNASFEVVHSNNVSEPHSCKRCEHIYFKNEPGNKACSLCKRCLPSQNVYTHIACDTTFDAHCDACTVCHNQADVDTAAEQWAGVQCSENADTVCANCTLCNFLLEYEETPCSENTDRLCSIISRSRTCEVGQYAGNHSRTKNSQCLQCEMNDTLYEGQRLHDLSSPGNVYDDKFSCNISCRRFSRLRDPQNPTLGCETCETGNVLFKIFTQNDLECTFTCVVGYVRHGDDCVLGHLQPSVSNYWNHSLNVTHVQRVAINGSGGFRFTVSHTAHGRFVVVVGPTEPNCAGKALQSSLQSICCFKQLWRVSSKHQLGLVNSAQETCSLHNPPPSLQLSDTQLQFDVLDDRLLQVASCKTVLNSSFGGQACVLHVSIVDAVLLHYFSVAVPLELLRGEARAFLPGHHTYIPLNSFHVEVQLAYMDADKPVFLVITDTVPLSEAGTTDVFLNSLLVHVHPGPEINCFRYAGHEHNSSITTWSLDDVPVRASTFFRADPGTTFLKLSYTLRLRDREGMPVAASVINLARACSQGACPTTASSYWGGEAQYHPDKAVDGDLSSDNTFVSSEQVGSFLRVDMEQTVSVVRVRIYNRGACCQERLVNFEIRVGNSFGVLENPACVTNGQNFFDFQDFTCVLSGRYITLQITNYAILNIREIEVYGTKSAQSVETVATSQTKNTMTIAVWRNLSLAHAVCAPAPLPLATNLGQVLSCSGLGAHVVSAATALHGPIETVHGELGGLTSFVARALHAHVHKINAVSILAAFALQPAVSLLTANVTTMISGNLEFTDFFSVACASNVFCHFQHVYQSPGVYFLRNCDSASLQAARAWLQQTLGVVYDAGHVQALCDLAQHRDQAFLVTLLNTRAYLPRTVQWHDLQNHSAALSSSRVFALFEFV